MPTYEYACSDCGNEWEEVQKISEAAMTECPKCHHQSAKRLVSGGNFILKGGGWYSDLYSSPKPASGKGGGKGDSDGGSSPSKSGGDGATSTGSSAGGSASESKSAPSTPSTPKSKD